MFKLKEKKNKMKFESILYLWLNLKKRELKHSSYVKYQNLINNHIAPSLGNYRLPKLTCDALNGFIAEKLKPSEPSARGLSAKTINDIIAIVKAVMLFAHIDIDGKLYLPRVEKNNTKALLKHEQISLEKYLLFDIDESKLGVLLCLYTGLRIGEICALKWLDISIENSTLTVRYTMQRIQNPDKSGAKTVVAVTPPKTACSNRRIPLPACLLSALRHFKPENPESYFLTGNAFQYIEPRTYLYQFKSYLDGAGINNAKFHSLRHTFATRWIEQGHSIKYLSEILGHSNINITLDTYTHPSFDTIRASMDKMSFLSDY